SVQDNFIRF
uniref:FMRFamide-1 n=1 Tax=Lucilia cuprina TaxID=7375 RepID=FAR1_LUCCU|nr:RecName: Full=FMRFamide-1; AltName: Full=LucFMRFamide-1 [Lucilia cuprina]